MSVTGRPGSAAAVLPGGLEDRVDQLPRCEGPGRVVHGDEFAGRVDPLQAGRDRVEALGAPIDDLDIKERDVGPIAPVEPLAILRRDGDDQLRHVLAVDERLDGPEPDGPTADLVVDLLLPRSPNRVDRPAAGKMTANVPIVAAPRFLRLAASPTVLWGSAIVRVNE